MEDTMIGRIGVLIVSLVLVSHPSAVVHAGWAGGSAAKPFSAFESGTTPDTATRPARALAVAASPDIPPTLAVVPTTIPEIAPRIPITIEAIATKEPGAPEGPEAPAEKLPVIDHCGTIAANETWATEYVHRVACSVTVPAGMTLTLLPGTVVKPRSRSISILVQGTLTAKGSESQPVVITSLLDDSAGGDTNNDGSASAPKRGDWDAIVVTGGGRLEMSHAQVRYGGGDTYQSDFDANIYLDDNASATLDHVDVSYSTWDGIQARTKAVGTTTRLAFTNGTASNNNQSGIAVYKTAGTLEATISGSTFRKNSSGITMNSADSFVLSDNSFVDNGRAGSLHFAATTAYLFGSNSGSGNNANGLLLSGTIGKSGVLAANPTFPYLISSSLTLGTGAELTIPAGTVIKLGPQYTHRLTVNGIMRVQGTSVAPVVITSLLDDSAGGDTNNDGSASAPKRGDWDAIVVTGGGRLEMSYAQVRYGGGDTYQSQFDANIYVSGGAAAVLDHVVVSDSTFFGVQLKADTAGTTTQLTFTNGELRENGQTSIYASKTIGTLRASIHNSSLPGNRGGVVNGDPTNPIDAQSNWWGDASGPFHSSLNPSGKGNSVGDGVLFIPWLGMPPAGDYVISGAVTHADGRPIPDVVISTGAGNSATTDASGNYKLAGRPAGTYTLTPFGSGYTFSPTSQSVTLPPNQLGINFAGTPIDSQAFKVRVILAEPSDETHDPAHNSEYYRELFESVRSYHIENSMGYVTLNLEQIYDSGGSWYKLGRTHAQYARAPSDFVKDALFDAFGTKSIPRDTIAVVVHAGEGSETIAPPDDVNHIRSQTWESSDSEYGNKLVVSEHSPIGVWAHEIGHDLGSLLLRSCTPDLYVHGDLSTWDLMAAGSWNSLTGASNRGSSPDHMSSYTKEFLQLLRYQRVNLGTSGSYWINLLPRNQLKDPVLQYVVTQHDDGTPDIYYILEARSQGSGYSLWDRSVPKSGLVLYRVNTSGNPKYGPYSSNVLVNVNVADALSDSGTPSDTSYSDLDHMIRFRVTDKRASSTSYALKVEIDTPAPDPIWLAGVVLRPAGEVATDVAPWRPIAAPSLYDAPEPDLDLHVYADDGRHVGMNYVTGEYEVQVDGAETSGNQINSHEWILLPAGTGFHYTVRSAPTQAFLVDNPDLAAHTEGSDSYVVYGLVSDPASGFHAGPTQTVAVPRGVDMEHAVIPVGSTEVQIGPAQPKMWPMDLAVEASGPSLMAPGAQAAYSLRFGSTGGSMASNVRLDVTLPTNTDLVSAPGFSQVGPDRLAYQVASLAPAEVQYAQVTLRLHPGTPHGTPLLFQARVSDDGSHGPDRVPGDNEVTLTAHAGTQVWFPIVLRPEE
jgi:M6 family metalloprotease-like protein